MTTITGQLSQDDIEEIKITHALTDPRNDPNHPNYFPNVRYGTTEELSQTPINPKTGMKYTIYDIQGGDLPPASKSEAMEKPAPVLIGYSAEVREYPVANEIHAPVAANDPIQDLINNIGNFFNSIFQMIGGLFK